MIEDRRTVVAEAAIAALATRGARGLTHRAVDQLAGLPEGSTSYYFRTRAALLQACAEHLVARTQRELGPALEERAQLTLQELAALAAQAVCAWTAEGGLLVLARHELLLESARQPEIHQTLTAASGYLQKWLEDRIAELGLPAAPARAAELIACLDGIALAAAVAGQPDGDAVGRSVTRVVNGLLTEP
ncbi:TetR/AcrR family transcriptional regulator [Mycolicibacterium phocaicum]|uniref:TetR family transcriptional regulator n=1 Tax=Mycolicibacterium phocaicum TaxID=319706 RepID=A0A7I7ZIR6_9MYCO|nr:TetR/AcrR family transcriptional regulator [Mycolicibacterium phocaicum]TLH68705.1 TetR family transcriptional regulator [Mycolicibacterium phocaicum]BBZ53980.1 putative transcriptional regulator, TetR family protein [Mycolicibacterium phocaicum]